DGRLPDARCALVADRRRAQPHRRALCLQLPHPRARARSGAAQRRAGPGDHLPARQRAQRQRRTALELVIMNTRIARIALIACALAAAVAASPAAAEKLQRLRIAGPPAAVSYPLVEMVESGALENYA